MKTMITDGQRLELYTILDISRATGINRSRVWTRVRMRKTIPAPTKKVGRRYYYLPDEFAQIVALIAEEQAATSC